MVTPSLDIAQGSEHDWSMYINADESIVVEKVSDPAAPENNPGRGLPLQPKLWLARKANPKDGLWKLPLKKTANRLAI